VLQASVIWAQSLGVPIVMDLGRVCDTEHAKMLCVCQWVCVWYVRGGRYGLDSVQWNAFNVGLAYTVQYFRKAAAKKLFQSMKAQSPSLVAVFASPINCCCTLWWSVIWSLPTMGHDWNLVIMRNTPLVWFCREWLVVKWLTHCDCGTSWVWQSLTCFLRVRLSSPLLGDKPFAERA